MPWLWACYAPPTSTSSSKTVVTSPSLHPSTPTTTTYPTPALAHRQVGYFGCEVFARGFQRTKGMFYCYTCSLVSLLFYLLLLLGSSSQCDKGTLSVKRRLACELVTYFSQAHYYLSGCNPSGSYGKKLMLFLKLKCCMTLGPLRSNCYKNASRPLKAQIDKLQQECDEFQKMIIEYQQVHNQQIHEMKKKDKEYIKLQAPFLGVEYNDVHCRRLGEVHKNISDNSLHGVTYVGCSVSRQAFRLSSTIPNWK
ncbi:hypothetical protein GUJ93_ZPchr0014g47600 [Zizania palustris]|uniref:Uncharacterized protein n=1 Tax=Zizania palustris TaxID=103762 RepID=A0A8J5TKQ8_ZIZPA|nr:hypothetical protein GUJ93_ZPchr0014g47600 [Zizania palustris]